ncbi:MAG: fasciclin domain-containing protein [Niabella sp.]
MKKSIIIITAFVSLLIVGCNKNSYYKDSGTTKGKFDGTVMNYLESKPEYFDSIVRLVRKAGLETTLQNEQVTFFAPADSSLRRLFFYTNERLARLGRPAIHSINEVSDRIWTKYMSRYVFKFKKGLNDFPQVDFANLTTYAGQIYPAANGTYMNIGAVYSNVTLGGTNGAPSTVIPYAGYRYLTVSYLSSQYNTRDYDTWRTATVASVNIETNNGYVHALRYANHDFGFDLNEFVQDVAYNNY